VPREPFEQLVRRAVGRLLRPALHCKDLVQARWMPPGFQGLTGAG
jgi:hypothetical protein